MPVPNTAHFIWYGESFPWMNTLALQSAHEHGGFARIVLHFDDRLDANVRARLGRLMPKLELRPIDPERIFAPLGELAGQLRELHAQMRTPAARANVLRAAVLASEGGVYLDIDTITIESLQPLLHETFCGAEPVAFPARVMQSRNPLRLGRAVALHGLRLALRETPRGYLAFRNIEPWFERAANNAVLAAAPGDPFMRALLEAMVSLPKQRQHVRFALGTHLLQSTIASHPTLIHVHEPEVFYPLGPEISRHWFRIEPESLRMDLKLAAVITPKTRVVHWYASVRNRAIVDQMSPAFVRAHANRQLLSALAMRTPQACVNAMDEL